MTNEYFITPGYPESPAEKEFWEIEAGYFDYEPPDFDAPPDTVNRTGWGIHNDDFPPDDALLWTMAWFRKKGGNLPQADQYGLPYKAKSKYWWSLVSTVMAHFLWFKEQEGVEYLGKLYGIEEVPPFWDPHVEYDSYYYYYRPERGEITQLPVKGEWQLRIWEKHDYPEVAAPVTQEDESVMDYMQSLLEARRHPYADGEMSHAAHSMYAWVSAMIRDWLLEEFPARDLLGLSPERISGYQWVRSHERSPGRPFYEFITNVELYGDIAYRLMDREENRIWGGPGMVHSVPARDVLKDKGLITMHELENAYRCGSCGELRNCRPVTTNGMCAHCFGSFEEKDVRPTLDLCTRRECGGEMSACPKFIATKRELVNLKNRLNRDPDFPVSR
jgi:hypothetical protein